MVVDLEVGSMGRESKGRSILGTEQAIERHQLFKRVIPTGLSVVSLTLSWWPPSILLATSLDGAVVSL